MKGKSKGKSYGKGEGKEEGAGVGRRNLLIIVVVIIIVLLVAVGGTVREPTVAVTGMTVSMSGTTMQTSFTVDVDNPNIAGARVLEITGKAYTNGRYAGDFSRTDPVDIPAMGTTTFDVDFQLRNVPDIRWNANNKIRVTGTFVIDGAIVDWEVGFDETRTVHVP